MQMTRWCEIRYFTEPLSYQLIDGPYSSPDEARAAVDQDKARAYGNVSIVATELIETLYMNGKEIGQ